MSLKLEEARRDFMRAAFAAKPFVSSEGTLGRLLARAFVMAPDRFEPSPDAVGSALALLLSREHWNPTPPVWLITQTCAVIRSWRELRSGEEDLIGRPVWPVSSDYPVSVVVTSPRAGEPLDIQRPKRRPAPTVPEGRVRLPAQLLDLRPGESLACFQRRAAAMAREAAAAAYKRRGKYPDARPPEVVPGKRAARWLAEHVVAGVSLRDHSRADGVAVSTVSASISALAEALEIELPPHWNRP